MIIKDIRCKFKDGLIYIFVESLNGKGESIFKGEQEEFNILNSNKSNFLNLEISKAEDFLKIEEILKGRNKLIIGLEFAVLDCFKSPWRFFNKETKKIPRPMNVCYSSKRENCFKELMTFSLDAKSFSNALEANKKIQESFNEKVKEEMDDNEKLTLLNDCIKEETLGMDLNVKIGVNIGELDGLYSEKAITYLDGLIDKHNICYVEGLFKDKKLASKFAEKVKHKCFVASEFFDTNCRVFGASPIGELSKGINGVEEAKTVVFSLKKDMKMFSHLAVGFCVPMVKYRLENVDCINELKRIERNMKGRKWLNFW